MKGSESSAGRIDHFSDIYILTWNKPIENIREKRERKEGKKDVSQLDHHCTLHHCGNPCICGLEFCPDPKNAGRNG